MTSIILDHSDTYQGIHTILEKSFSLELKEFLSFHAFIGLERPYGSKSGWPRKIIGQCSFKQHIFPRDGQIIWSPIIWANEYSINSTQISCWGFGNSPANCKLSWADAAI